MKLCICNEMFEDWQLRDVFRFAAEIGFEAVEIAPYTIARSAEEITPTQRETIRRDAEDAGVEIAGLHWLFVSPEGLYLNGPDAELRARTRDYLLELVRLCGDLGGRIMVLGSPKQRNVADGMTWQQAFDHTVESLKPCAELAGERGVVLCFEPLTSSSTDFINTPAEAVQIVEAVGHPNLQIILDVYSSSAEGLDIPAEIRTYAPHIRHVHTNDDNGYVPGSGGADYPAIVRALRETGYAGYLSVEVFDFQPDPETIARESYRFLRSLVPESSS